MQEAIQSLRDSVVGVVETLEFEPEIDLESWTQAIERRLLPRLSDEFPLLAAICGGGSTGKSTLFNSLTRSEHSPTGGMAGINRRILAGGHPDLLESPSLLEQVFEPFGALPDRLDTSDQLTTPGDPLYAVCPELPKGVVLLDTPDFDTGAGGEYANRGLAAPVLEACDVLVYLFTNATYNNLANTEFIRKVLTDLGQRPCVLIYRAYESYSDEQVLDHASVVARNLYGDDPDEHVLGIYRAHDSNDVASGVAPTQLLPLRGAPPLLELLSGLDAREMRREQIGLILQDVLSQGATVLRQAKTAAHQLELYRDALHVVQSHCVYRGLVSLPVQDVGNRLHRLWEQSSPASLKLLRNTSKVLGFPVKAGLKVFQWTKSLMGEEAEPTKSAKSLHARIEELEEAAGELNRQLLVDQLASKTTEADPAGQHIQSLILDIRAALEITDSSAPFTIPAGKGSFDFTVDFHAALSGARAAYQKRDWEERLKELHERAKAIIDVPVDSRSDADARLDAELTEVIADFRKQMSLNQRVRESLFASLHLVPPVLAISYVLTTGDVAGGAVVAQAGVKAGIAAKVSGLFGLHDLWALVALPANTGLSEADQKQLKGMLTPVVQKWFQTRSTMIEKLFEELLTGSILSEAAERLSKANEFAAKANHALEQAENAP